MAVMDQERARYKTCWNIYGPIGPRCNWSSPFASSNKTAVAEFLAAPHRRDHETVTQVLQRDFRDQCIQDTRDVDSLASRWPRFFDWSEEAEKENQ